MKKGMKLAGILSLLAVTALMTTGCEKKETGPSPQEIQYEKNVAITPEITKKTGELIEKSYGTPLTEEEIDQIKSETPDGEEPDLHPNDSVSPGKEMAVSLSILPKKELQKLDKETKLSIFINGIIRDEYRVAANVLYGPDKVKAYKDQFKKALLKEVVVDEYTKEKSTVIDSHLEIVGVKSKSFFSKNIDLLINHLNSVYVKPVIQTDLETKLTVDGLTKKLKFSDAVSGLNQDAENFVSFDLSNSFGDLNKENQEEMDGFYKSSFDITLKNAPLDASSESTGVLGGFTQGEDGNWEPVDFDKFGINYVVLAFGL